MNESDVAKIYDGIAKLFDGDVVESINIHRGGVCRNQVVDGPDFLIPGWQDDVLQRQRMSDICRA